MTLIKKIFLIALGILVLAGCAKPVTPTAEPPQAGGGQPVTAPTDQPATPKPANVIPAPSVITVSLQAPPQDVNLQIGNYIGGAGPGEDACMHIDEITSPQWMQGDLNTLMRVTIPLTAVTVCGCGLGQASGAVSDPLGNAMPVSVQSEQWGNCTAVTVPVQPNMLLGSYQVSLEDASQKLTGTFDISMPSAPAGVWTSQGAWFAGFPPNAPIRILIFGASQNTQSMVFLAEKNANADPNGMALVTYTDKPDDIFSLVIGIVDEGGKVLAVTDSEMIIGPEHVIEDFLSQSK